MKKQRYVDVSVGFFMLIGLLALLKVTWLVLILPILVG